jgi:hypothetical protein
MAEDNGALVIRGDKIAIWGEMTELRTGAGGGSEDNKGIRSNER